MQITALTPFKVIQCH